MSKSTHETASILGRRTLLRSALALAPVAVATVPQVVNADDADHEEGPDTAAAMPGPSTVQKLFFSIRKHENAHVLFLLNALGNAARPKPNFQFLEQNDFNKFLQLARTFENVGSRAYLGAAGYIRNKGILDSASSIALVEARHAGALNVFLGYNVTLNNESFEDPLTDDEVNDAVAPYIQNLNGGPPVGYNLTRTDNNDINILNFALALEYLEARFYNLNVPKFFTTRSTGTSSDDN